MSDSPEMEKAAAAAVEQHALITMPGSGGDDGGCCNSNVRTSGRVATFLCNDVHHRKLAVCSIICGITCIGIKALIYSVKAETTENANAKTLFSQQAKKFGIISIGVWIGLLISFPILITFISYLLTLQD